MSRTCRIDGCGRPYYAKGLCVVHYNRERTYGAADVPLRRPQGDHLHFLLREVLPFRGQGCLTWPFVRSQGGYGQIRIGGSNRGVHREVCWATHGAPAHEADEARHLCGNGHLGCVNPTHIVWGTALQNQHDRLAHGTDSRGARSGRHKIDEATVRLIRADLDAGKHQEQIAESYGVSQSLVSAIKLRRVWSWLP